MPKVRSFTEQRRDDASVPPLNAHDETANEKHENIEDDEASEAMGAESPTNTLLDEAV